MPRWGFGRAEESFIDADRQVERWADRIPWLNTYATVLVVILLDLLLIGIFGDSPWGQLFTLLTRVMVLLLALHISKVRARWDALAVLLAAVAVAIATGALLGGKAWGVTVATLIGIVLLLVPPFAIARRLGAIIREQGVVLEAVWAALSIYLLLGMVYSSVFASVALLWGQAFFVQEKTPAAIDYVYFSFTTLTTIGYGDLTAAGSLGRMLAVSEGLFGQLYLVTVVALVVSNFGRGRAASRGRADAPKPEQVDEPAD